MSGKSQRAEGEGHLVSDIRVGLERPGGPSPTAADRLRYLEELSLSGAPGGRIPGNTSTCSASAAAALNRDFAIIACDDGLVRVLIPVPDRDFDVTEVAVPWRVLRDAGHDIVFATEQAGTLPAAEPRLLTGCCSGSWAPLPRPRITTPSSRAGRQLPVRALAGRRLPVRPPVP
jgi:hypothetical protein